MRKLLIAALAIIIALSSTVYATPAGPYVNGYVEGYYEGIIDGSVKIEEYDGTVHMLPFADKAICFIDQRPVRPGDFKPGMEVYAELSGRSITLMESFSTENPGYIAPGSKVRSGTVTEIDRDLLIIKLSDGSSETYFTNPATLVSRKGVTVPLSSLYEGDRVRLYFDEADSAIISRMQIEGDSIIIKDLYRGVLASISPLDETMAFENVEKLENGKWTAVKRAMSMPYSGDAPIYAAGYKISGRNLKYYAGSTAYMAVNTVFGKDRIERMIFKSRYESSFSDKIRQINWFTGAFELSGRQNISFNDGTLIIRNGRLVDQYAIPPLSDAFVVADGRGSELMADIVYIYNEEINNSNIGQSSIYCGRLDEITESRVQLRDFFLLDKNDWESFSKKKELYYDADTYIYDLEAMKTVTPKEFMSEDYAVDESTDYARDNNLKDWYGYIYTDGDRISAIVVQKRLDSLLAQRVTTGTAAGIEDDPLVGWTLELNNGADWSTRKEKWMSKDVPVRISFNKALILKNGRAAETGGIVPGDRLYIVRDGFEAKVIIIK